MWTLPGGLCCLSFPYLLCSFLLMFQFGSVLFCALPAGPRPLLRSLGAFSLVLLVSLNFVA